MAEQLKLFENLPVLNQNINKPKEPTEDQQSQKQLEKYATQKNYGGKLWNAFVGDDKTADAQRKKLIQSTIKSSPNKVESHQKQKPPFHIFNPVTQELDNVNDPNYLKPKPRVETMEERIDRLRYELDDNDEKPAHYNNPNIVSYENWKTKPEKWDGYHNLSNNQKQQSVAWNEHLNIAKKPRSPEERREALDTKRMLMQTYNNPKLKNTLADDELKLIGKHKSQQPQVTPIVTAAPVPYVPAPVQQQLPLEEIIRIKADAKLRQQQMDHDYTYGRGGLASLSRPK